MHILSIAIGVIFLIYLLMRISGMAGRSTAAATTEHCDHRPKLPERSVDEVEKLLNSMPTAWVTYEGMTPPLELKVRGMTEELYRRVMRAYLDAFGQENLDLLPMDEKLKVMHGYLPDINAQAYVLDWRGAKYPNGNPVPYSTRNLASFMRKDEMLNNFVSEEAGKLSATVGWV